MPRPPLLRPRLLQPQKFSCSGPPCAKEKGPPYDEGCKPPSDDYNCLPMRTVPLQFRNSPGSNRPWRTEPTWPSDRAHSLLGCQAMQSRPGQLLSNYFKRPVQFGLAAERPQRNHQHAMRIQAVPPSGGRRPLWGLLNRRLWLRPRTALCGTTTRIPYRRNSGELVPSARLKISRRQGWARHATRIGRDPTECSQGLLLFSVTPEEFSSGHRPWRVKYETGEKSATLKMEKSIASCMNRRITFEVPETSNPRPSRCSRYSRSSRQFSRTLIVIPQPASPHPDDCA